jgi:hypothetical protein
MVPLAHFFSNDSVTPGAGDLCLDSVELTASSEPVDADLAAYINNPAWSLGTSATSDSRASSSKQSLKMKVTKTGRKRFSVAKAKPTKVPKEEYEVDVQVHFSKPKAARKARKPKAPKKKKKVVYREEEDSVSSVSSACAIISDVDSDATVIEEMPDEELGDERGEEVVDNQGAEKGTEESKEEGEDVGERTFGDLPIFTCEFCGKTFDTTALKRHHIIKRHRHEQFTTVTCPQVQCDQQFDDIEAYRSHCIGSHGLYVCRVGVCTFTSDVETKVSSHDSVIHKGEFRCTFRLCTHRAEFRKGLEYHIRDMHTIFPCPYCRKKFYGKLRLIKHKSKQHKNKCDNCGRWFVNRTHLLRHQASSKAKGTCPKIKKRIRDRSKKAKTLLEASKEPLLSAKQQTSSSTSKAKSAESSTRKRGRPRKQAQPHASISTADPSDTAPVITDCDNIASVSGDQVTLSPVVDLVRIKTEAVDQEDLNQQMNDAVALAVGEEVKGEGADVKPKIKEKRDYRRKNYLIKSWCRLCNKQLDTETALFNHLSQKHPEKSFACDQCDVVYVRKECLTRHVKSVHEKFKYECSFCPETFTVAVLFKAHSVNEHGEPKAFKCKQCNKRYNRQKALQNHIDIHHTHKRLGQVCNTCGGTFYHLRQHEKNCLRLEQHLCSTCGEVGLCWC